MLYLARNNTTIRQVRAVLATSFNGAWKRPRTEGLLYYMLQGWAYGYSYESRWACAVSYIAESLLSLPLQYLPQLITLLT